MTPLDQRVAEILRAAGGSMVFDGLQSRLGGISADQLRASLDRLIGAGHVHHQPLGSRGLYRWITDELRETLAPSVPDITNRDARRAAIAQLLVARPAPSNVQICRRLGISKSTLQRDMDQLRAEGVADPRPVATRRVPRPDDESMRAKLLALIVEKPGQTTAELATRTAVATDSIGPVLSRLQSTGLITRAGQWRCRWHPTTAAKTTDGTDMPTKLETLRKLSEIVCPSIAQVLLEVAEDLRRAGREVRA